MPTFPAVELRFTFGDWTPPPALARLADTALSWRSNQGDVAVSLLISEFQRKPVLEAMLRAFAAGVQDLHDAAWQVLTGVWIDTAEGVQLDGLGVIVDLPRRGWGDDTYRAYLRAQVLVLRSEGTWPDLRAIMRAVGVRTELARKADSGVAAIRIGLGELLELDVRPADVYALLVDGKPAGVRLRLEFPIVAVEETFAASDDGDWHYDEHRGAADDSRSIGGHVAGDLRTTEAA